MTDYIYGYRAPDGYINLSTSFSEKGVRVMGLGCDPIRIPVSAIEPLPEPKPALPTTPGSVVRVIPSNTFYMLNEWSQWVRHNSARDSVAFGQWAWEVVFDAGAHDEGQGQSDEAN